MDQKNQQSGSALIITILLVTVLAAIAFSTSRLTISEIIQTGQLEDSELAYQAAEAGVEMGLLLYRYNRNSEIPEENMSSDVSNVCRFRIATGGPCDDLEDSQNPPVNKNESYFDLHMWHKNDGNTEYVKAKGCTKKIYDAAPELCVEDTEGWCEGKTFKDPNGNDDTVEGECYSPDSGLTKYIYPAIVQDQVVEYDVSDVDNINLKWEYVEDVDSLPRPEREKFKLLFLPIDENGKIIEELGYKGWFSYNESNSTDEKYTTGAQKIRMKPFGGSLISYTISTTEDVKLDSRYTFIESIGYYGSAKRKLKISLDRKTKSLLTPYDFLIYSSQEK